MKRVVNDMSEKDPESDAAHKQPSRVKKDPVKAYLLHNGSPSMVIRQGINPQRKQYISYNDIDIVL